MNKFKIYILLSLLISLVNQSLSVGKDKNLNSSNFIAYNGYTFINDESEETNSNEDLTPEQLEQKAEQLLLKVQADNRYIGMLANDKVYNLPVGIYKNIAGIEYTIVLDDFVIDPQGASLKAYLTIEVPGSTNKLGFYADNVRIGPEGIETAQLKLIRSIPISFGGFTMLFRNDVTMVQWDCNGYQSTTIGGDIEFPSGIIKPIGANEADTSVMGNFYANFYDFNDLIIGFSMSPFEVNGLPDFEFHPNEVFVDLSDIRNPEGVTYPFTYFPEGTGEQIMKLWRGLYIPSFSVILPSSFSNNNDQLSISANQLLIDGNGITGAIFASNIVNIDEGNLSGWKFSIDTLGFSFIKNNFSDFKINGEIKIPVSDDDKGFKYAGLIDSYGRIGLVVLNSDDFEAKLWGAQITLEENSLIEIIEFNGLYKPRAVLHGEMEINLSDEVNLSKFDFQNLVVDSDPPFLTIGSFTMSSGLLEGFPLSVSNIGFKQEENKVGLFMQANINFMESNQSGFGASGSFTIWAERNNSSGYISYTYKQTQIHGFSINVNQGAYEIEGGLEIYQENQTYGNGFKGMVNARFKPGIVVRAVAQFGKVKNFRYWYVDALLGKPSGVQIFSGVAIYGFGGGASYRMKAIEPTSYNLPQNEQTATSSNPLAGTFFSGKTYTPDSSYGLGLKASVILGTYPSPKAVNGQISFTIQFYSSGGVESINLNGNACMASDIGTNPNNTPIRLTLNISYNFRENSLYGVNEAFVNIPNTINGILPGNKAGSVIFLFNPNQWFVHVGTPNSRIGLELLNTISLSGYFMVGTNIPPLPNPPSNVASIVNSGNIQNIEEGLTSTGKGFAFGATFNANTGEKNFLIFYGSFNIGAGFDLMLKDYGNEAYCEGSNPPLGVNGWYSIGQAYAFIIGDIGVNFNLFGGDQKIEILTISAAALLQIKLPNPSYFVGQVSGSYNILGGLVKGYCHFEFSVGNDCVIANANPLGNIEVIADISPENGSSDISVFVTPQVAFNIPIDAPFQLLDQNNQTKSYKIILQSFNIIVNNNSFSGNLKWNSDKKVVSFETTEIYPSNALVKIDVKVLFQVLENNNWVNCTISGQNQIEEQSLTFTTGERPDHIPQECIEYSYPIANMLNFHWKEHGNGYIKLTHNFDYLLNDEANWTREVIFDISNTSLKSRFNYNSQALKIIFPIPTNLSGEKIYNIRISKIPSSKIAEVDENVERLVVSQSETHQQTQAKIEGERIVALERILYQINVRTSKYSKFSEKINLLALGSSTTQVVMTGIHHLIRFGNIPEEFDLFEIAENQYNSLVQVEFKLSDNYWFNTYINPLIYDGYPILPNLNITWRDTSILGIPPIRAGYIYQSSISNSLGNVTLGESMVLPSTSIGIKFVGVLVMYQDYMDIRNKAAAAYYPGVTNANIYEKLINSSFQSIILEQQYKLRIRYVIPGENIVTSTKEIVCEI